MQRHALAIGTQNLDKTIDNKALHDTFSAFGRILSCKVATDSNGQSKGYGFVHFETEEAAQLAITKVNGMMIEDRIVYVGPFLRRTDRPMVGRGRSASPGGAQGGRRGWGLLGVEVQSMLLEQAGASLGA